jgi:hypothetical protein
MPAIPLTIARRVARAMSESSTTLITENDVGLLIVASKRERH